MFLNSRAAKGRGRGKAQITTHVLDIWGCTVSYLSYDLAINFLTKQSHNIAGTMKTFQQTCLVQNTNKQTNKKLKD